MGQKMPNVVHKAYWYLLSQMANFPKIFSIIIKSFKQKKKNKKDYDFKLVY